MGKHFGWVNKECYDFEYKPLGDGLFTSVYLGEHLICQTAKNHRGRFCVVVQGKLADNIPRLVEGFATRWDAIQYALKVHPLTADYYNR